MNAKRTSAATYHWSTGYRRHELKSHRLDWANQPILTKGYPDLPRSDLDPAVNLPHLDFFQLADGRLGTIAGRTGRPTIDDLSRIFRLAQRD